MTHALAFLCTALLVGWFLPTLALAQPKIALHATTATVAKGTPCNLAPETIPCSQFQTAADWNQSYSVFVLVADFDPADGGVGGATFGINYDSSPGNDLIYGWTKCGDQDFPGGGWPDSGGGNVVTFDAINNCQTTNAGEGIQATLGFFYVYAYGDHTLTVTPRSYVAQADLSVTNCGAVDTDIPTNFGGIVKFSQGATVPGGNPCTGIPPDITPPTLVGLTYTETPPEVVLEFSELVTNAANPANYDLEQTTDPYNILYDVVHSGQFVTFDLLNPLVGGEEHVVTINNVTDLAGNPLAANTTATFTPAADPPPEVVAASYTSTTNTVLVFFSQSVSTGANVPGNYALFETAAPGNTVLVTGAVTLGSSVRLTLGAVPAPSTQHTVQVNNVENTSGQPVPPNSSANFITPAADTDPPNLTAVSYQAVVPSLTLFFSELLAGNAETLTNYEVFESATPANTIPVTAATLNGSVVTLNLGSAATPGVQHTVVVNNVSDLNGNPVAPNTSRVFTPSVDTTPPQLSTVSGILGAAVINAGFTEAMGAGLTDPTNYALERVNGASLLITSASPSGTSGVTLGLTQTLTAGNYRLTVSNVEDAAGNPVAPGESRTFAVVPTDPGAGLQNPRLAAHIQPALVGKGDRCAAEAGNACADFDVQGEVGVDYDLYLVAVDWYEFGSSFGGASFGIDYGPNLAVTSWATCADQEFAGNGFPASGGGNAVAFDTITNCQLTNAGDGARAVLGWFSVYANGTDSFSVTRRNYVASPDLKAADCSAAEVNIPYPSGAGTVGFGLSGYSPCGGGGPTPIQPTTWGAIKRQFGKDADQ